MQNKPQLSEKGQKLIQLYETMADSGYDRTDGARIEKAYNDFELRKFRAHVKPVYQDFRIKTVLDYGCGGSDWNAPNFDETGISAKDFFKLNDVYRYEPARDLDERQKADCVNNFDVLEHIFVSDVPNVLRDILSYARKLAVINVACYKSGALLPNGENAHITARPPLWWKGMLDNISTEFPDVSIMLLCSTSFRDVEMYPIWKAQDWQDVPEFDIKL